MTHSEKLEATKSAILLLLNASGPQSIESILSECKRQAFAGCMAFALSNLNYQGLIFWNDEDQVYDVM